MARRKHPAVPASADGALIMPAELFRRCLDPGESSVAHKERTRWLRDHGVDPGDWSQLHPVLVESGRAHGIPWSALDRVWVRAVGLEEWRRIHQGRQGGSA